MTVRLDTLPNGLRVVSDDMPHLETTSIGIWVDTGARHEAVEINGISHLLEHMAFKGTERRSAQAIAEEIEAVGGSLNAYTSAEHTAYFARVLKADVPLAVDVLADILQHSTFEDAELERERAVVIQEIGQTHDTPDDVIFDHFQMAAYPDQALGRSILGTVERVEGFDSGQLRGYMSHHYQAERMVVCAAGAVDHRRLVDLVGDAFDGLVASPSASVERARYDGGSYREQRDLEQIHFLIGFDGFAYGDPDYYAAQVYSTILGGGMSSRLFQEVRERRGLAYSVYSFASSYVDGGVLGVYAGTGTVEIETLVPVVCEEVGKLASSVNGDEVVRARNQLKAGLMMSLESSMSRCEQLGRQLLIFGRAIPVDELVAHIEAVDAAAVQRVGARLTMTATAPVVVAALGPINKLEPYERTRARFG